MPTKTQVTKYGPSKQHLGQGKQRGKRIKVCLAFVPTPHDEYNHYVLKTCTNILKTMDYLNIEPMKKVFLGKFHISE